MEPPENHAAGLARRPLLSVRGVHLDCRAQMLRFERWEMVFEDLARWGFNAVMIEYEDRFPYRGRLSEVVGEDALTRTQVRTIDRLARSLGLAIIPLVQCLGHLEYVLQHRAFASLREGGNGGRLSSTLCPADDRSRRLFRDMAGQILELHPEAAHFHMGGDEADLAEDCPRCAAERQRDGVSRVLVNHYVECADWLSQQGAQPILWCDMALRHPEALEALRGHVWMMDWDYWSRSRPTGPPRLWLSQHDASSNIDQADPATWPASHRRAFANELFIPGTRLGRPFLYTGYLRDRGFEVVVAPAARCAGDSFCVPAPQRIDNVIGAARAARREKVAGCVITSWAIRRAPWPITEYGLIVGAMALQNPGVARTRIDTAFAKEHFGVGDPDLARMPRLLGLAIPGLTAAQPNVRHAPTGQWLGPDAATRLRQLRQAPTENRRQMTRLKRGVASARRLLARARPKSARQRENVTWWRWALDVLEFFADLGRCLLDEAAEASTLRALRRRALALRTRSGELLAQLYTPRTVSQEQHARFDVWIDFLESTLASMTGTVAWSVAT